MPPRMDLKGQKFNMLTVLDFYDVQNGMSRWLCRCDCGNEVVVYGRHLKSGNTMSCGCYHKEHNGEFGYKHGGCKERLYSIWCDMKSRCNNPNNVAYRWYGGRGITVCNEWEHDYAAFREWAYNNGYKDNLTIDRIDSDKNYCPENCQWLPLKDNIEKDKIRYSGIAVNIVTGEKDRFSSVVEFAERHGLNAHSIHVALQKKDYFKDWKFTLDKTLNDYRKDSICLSQIDKVRCE